MKKLLLAIALLASNVAHSDDWIRINDDVWWNATRASTTYSEGKFKVLGYIRNATSQNPVVINCYDGLLHVGIGNDTFTTPFGRTTYVESICRAYVGK